MLDIFNYSFMVRAFLAGGIIAIIAPLIGNFLVMRRYSLIADTLSHIALSGVAIGILTGTQPILTTLVITILSAIAIEKIRTKNGLPGETILSMFLSAGLALSIVLMSLGNGIGTNIFQYLFGSITTVTNSDLAVITGMGLTTITLIPIFHKKLLYTAFDEDSARISGINVQAMNMLLIILTAVTVSLSMRIVGALLIGALMIIPTIASIKLARSHTETMGISVIIAFLSVALGLYLSYYANLPAGATIVLFSLAFFLASTVGAKK